MDRQTLGTATVINANSRQLPLADNSVDLVVTSPPYWSLRSYQDDGEHYAGQIGDEPTPTAFVDSLLDVTRECVRVLKPSGSLWVNLGDKYADAGAPAYGVRPKTLLGIPWRYAIRCADELGLVLRAEIVWSKPNGLPESVTDRVRRSHETWFHFTLEPRYFAGIDEIREPHATSATADKRGRAARGYPGAPTGEGVAGHPLGKVPGSVWEIPVEGLLVPKDLGVDHFAAFPTEWPRRIITGWSPAGICTACDQGLRPITERGPEYDAFRRSVGDYNKAARPEGGYDPSMGKQRAAVATVATDIRIVGYACQCNEPIATPTGSGGDPNGDPTLEQGGAGLRRERATGNGRRWITRHEQRHEAVMLRSLDLDITSALALEAGPSAFTHYTRTDIAGARPIPEHLRILWRDRGFLVDAPPYVPAPTRPAVVLDPFGGTGTTAMVAKALGRHGISVDASRDYCRIGQWRTNDRDQIARVLGIDKAPDVHPDQLDIFTVLDHVDEPPPAHPDRGRTSNRDRARDAARARR